MLCSIGDLTQSLFSSDIRLRFVFADRVVCLTRARVVLQISVGAVLVLRDVPVFGAPSCVLLVWLEQIANVFPAAIPLPDDLQLPVVMDDEDEQETTPPAVVESAVRRYVRWFLVT